MTELLQSPRQDHEDDAKVTTGELQAIFDSQNPAEQTDDTPIYDQLVAERNASAELSPTASLIRAAAHRMAGLLEGRAMKKRMKAEQDAAFDSYGDNISATRDRERAEKIERVEAFVDDATERVAAVGRTTLHGMKEAGMITVGIGYIAGESAVKGVKSGAETAALAGMAAGDKVKSAAETAAVAGMLAKDKAGELVTDGWNKAEAAAGAVGQKLENGIDKTVEFGADLKERFIARKEAARARRQARRERWSARIQAGKDAVTDKVERSKASVHTTRAAGQAALSAFQATRRTHSEQNRLY